MEQLEAINKIKAQEQVAQRIIEEAKVKASSMIQEVKFTKRKEMLKLAEDQANQEAQRLKEEFKRKAQESIERIEEETKQQIDKIKNVASKNKDRAKDYIVDETLKIWQ